MMKPALAVIAAVGAAIALTVAALPGQSTDVEALKKELETLKTRTAALERELADMRARLGIPKPPSTDSPISLSGAKIRGSASAKVMLLEFSDYQCPFCGRHFRETMPQIEKDVHRDRQDTVRLQGFPDRVAAPPGGQGPRSGKLRRGSG